MGVPGGCLSEIPVVVEGEDWPIAFLAGRNSRIDGFVSAVSNSQAARPRPLLHSRPS